MTQQPPPTVDASNDPNPPSTNLPFDQALAYVGRQFAIEQIGTHPELRSVVIVFDYGGKLNEASINKGVFYTSGDTATSFEATLGALSNMARVTEFMAKNASGVIGKLQQAAQEAAGSLAETHAKALEGEKRVQALTDEEKRLQTRIDTLRELGKLPAATADAAGPAD